MNSEDKHAHREGRSFKILSVILSIFLTAGLAGCTSSASAHIGTTAAGTAAASTAISASAVTETPGPSAESSAPVVTETSAPTPDTAAADTEGASSLSTGQEQTSGDAGFDLSSVPAYEGSPYVEINGNVPYFPDSDLTTASYENYGPLDSLGRCTTAVACIGQDLMPTEKRGDIGEVRPTGWHLVKYNGIDGNYLYNRCHLIGYQLTGENANKRNLITGTRYMNVEGMEPFESRTADYIKETGNHVLYRVTPEFNGDNLLADGVLMEAESVEDSGAGIQFCVFCYDVQPGITIDYATGDSSGPEFTGSDQSSQQTVTETPAPSPAEIQQEDGASSGTTYIINTNTGKFHYPDCPSVAKMKDANKEEYTGSRDDLISQGYEPCKNCNP